MSDGMSRKTIPIISTHSPMNQNKPMNTQIYTTAAGDAFLPVFIITHPRRNINRKRPPEPSPLGVWLLIALTAFVASLTTYLITK